MSFGMLRSLAGREMVFLRILMRYDTTFAYHAV